ncbi:hypothetical protein [Patulibacter defluvii]|uniref:hypothetical protein n=1 Tax=Patulibacter defluvii TaxID=3095358 RepID=UPI002A7649A9|nr:hypothetical protein [Patulibacter sp. DM4]
MTPIRLLALPLLLTAALGVTACGQSDEDKAKEKAEQFQKDVQSGKLSPQQIQDRTKEMLNDPEIRKQIDKLGGNVPSADDLKKQLDSLPSSEELKKQLDNIPNADEIKKQLEQSGVDTGDVEKRLEELKKQVGGN